MLHPKTIDLYRRFLYAGKDYSVPWSQMRIKVKEIMKPLMADKIEDKDSFMKGINYGRWYAKEMIAAIQMRKYRILKKRYGDQ